MSLIVIKWVDATGELTSIDYFKEYKPIGDFGIGTVVLHQATISPTEITVEPYDIIDEETQEEIIFKTRALQVSLEGQHGNERF